MTPKEKTGSAAGARRRVTWEDLGFVSVMVVPVKGRRHMERRSLAWWNEVKRAMGVKD